MQFSMRNGFIITMSEDELDEFAATYPGTLVSTGTGGTAATASYLSSNANRWPPTQQQNYSFQVPPTGRFDAFHTLPLPVQANMAPSAPFAPQALPKKPPPPSETTAHASAPKSTKKNVVKRAPKKLSARKKGPNFDDEEASSLLDTIEEVLPIGSQAWEEVTRVHSSVFGERKENSLRRKFNRLKSAKPPTGDPNCPPLVRRAKRIMQKIYKKSEATTLSLSDSEVEEEELDEKHEEKHEDDISVVKEADNSSSAEVSSLTTITGQVSQSGSRRSRRSREPPQNDSLKALTMIMEADFKARALAEQREARQQQQREEAERKREREYQRKERKRQKRERQRDLQRERKQDERLVMMVMLLTDGDNKKKTKALNELVANGNNPELDSSSSEGSSDEEDIYS